MPRLELFALTLALMPSASWAQPAPPGAAITFTGVCQREDVATKTKVECKGSVANIRFADGYDSFQFADGTRVINFIGHRWGDTKTTQGQVPEDVLFMTLDQIAITEIGRAQSVEAHQGQCELKFATNAQFSMSGVVSIACGYFGKDDGTDGHIFSLKAINDRQSVVVGGQSSAAGRGFLTYR